MACPRTAGTGTTAAGFVLDPIQNHLAGRRGDDYQNNDPHNHRRHYAATFPASFVDAFS